MSIAERLAIAPELRDTAKWDKPRESDIPKDDFEEYRRRKKAVAAYLNGTSFATIKKDCNYTKSQIYRMLDRCLSVRPNGTMYGFHALVPGVSIAPYQRKSPVNPELAAQTKGLAGAFMQLMAEHESLYRYVEKYALNSGGKSAAVIAKAIRAEFLKKCAKVRAPNQYPFNTDDQGARALVRFISRMREEHSQVIPARARRHVQLGRRVPQPVHRDDRHAR